MADMTQGAQSGQDAQVAAGGDEISLTVPRRSPHDMYLAHTLNTHGRFSQIIFTMTGLTDPRIVPYARQCIIQIADDNVRSKLLASLAYGVEWVKTCEDKDPTEKGELIIEVCQNALAQAYSYLDEHIGLSKVNALVPLGTVPNEKVEAAAREILGELPDDDGAGDDTGDSVGNGEKPSESMTPDSP